MTHDARKYRANAIHDAALLESPITRERLLVTKCFNAATPHRVWVGQARPAFFRPKCPCIRTETCAWTIFVVLKGERFHRVRRGYRAQTPVRGVSRTHDRIRGDRMTAGSKGKDRRVWARTRRPRVRRGPQWFGYLSSGHFRLQPSGSPRSPFLRISEFFVWYFFEGADAANCICGCCCN